MSKPSSTAAASACGCGAHSNPPQLDPGHRAGGHCERLLALRVLGSQHRHQDDGVAAMLMERAHLHKLDRPGDVALATNPVPAFGLIAPCAACCLLYLSAGKRRLKYFVAESARFGEKSVEALDMRRYPQQMAMQRIVAVAFGYRCRCALVVVVARRGRKSLLAEWRQTRARSSHEPRSNS